RCIPPHSATPPATPRSSTDRFRCARRPPTRGHLSLPVSRWSRTGREWFAGFEDHLTEPHIPAVQDFIPGGPKTPGNLLAGVVRDMLVRIRPDQDSSIDPLKDPPEPAAVIRRAQHQDPTRPKDSPHLGPDVRRIGDMLDHFGVDHRGNGARSEWEPVAARPDQQPMTRLQPTQFILKDVQPDRVGQVLDDPAGST